MIEETTVGLIARKESHCFSKSGKRIPLSWAGTCGPSSLGTLAFAALRRNHGEALLDPESKDSIEKVRCSATETGRPSRRSFPDSIEEPPSLPFHPPRQRQSLSRPARSRPLAPAKLVFADHTADKTLSLELSRFGRQEIFGCPYLSESVACLLVTIFRHARPRRCEALHP
jgi:hypothetical protein